MNPLLLFVSIVLPVALVIAEHYAPWRQWTGEDLSPFWRYILGSLAVFIPATICGFNTTSNHETIILFWIALAAAGAAVGLMRWVDNEREARHIAEDKLDRQTSLYDK